MNSFQSLWWEQAKSDHDIFLLLLGLRSSTHCHPLHYLQMTTEKIAKAYFWRSGSPPPKDHAGFVQFLRFLGQVRRSEQVRVANVFEFKRSDDFQSWLRQSLPIARELERLAPSLASHGPNVEYPWPHAQPQFAPATYNFPLWEKLMSGPGRRMMRIIGSAVHRFPEYADT